MIVVDLSCVCVFDIWVVLLCCCVQTPLHWAGYFGDADIVLMLLEHGADPTLKDVRLSNQAEFAVWEMEM